MSAPSLGRRLGDRAIYGAIRSGICAVGTLSAPALLAATRRIGRWFGNAGFNRKRLDRAMENLAVAFPEWSDEKRRAYAISSYEHILMLGVELAYTPRLLTIDAWAERVKLTVHPSIVRALVDGRPMIFITGHCGNWELSGYILALLGIPVHALYRPLDLEPLDRWVRQTRQRRGLELIDKFGAAKRLPEVLAAGEMLGFIADQNGGDRGLFVPFFNRLVSSYKAVGLAATRFDATIVCGMARRIGGGEVPGTGMRSEPGGMHYEVHVEDVFGPREYNAQPDPLFYITARYRRAIEGCVRRAPEQYLWMHRYWKSRPRHERTGRPFPPTLLEKIRSLPWITESDVAQILEHSRRDTEACIREFEKRAERATERGEADETTAPPAGMPGT